VSTDRFLIIFTRDSKMLRAF